MARAVRREIARWVSWMLVCGAAVFALSHASGLSAAAGARTVTVPIVAGQTPANGGFNFNGYGHGGMSVTVPAGWKVVIQFRNGSVLPHSAMVATEAAARSGTAPAAPAFAGAATKDVQSGLAQSTTATFSFTAVKPGMYAIMCGVPGHAAAGMWDKLIVSGSARAPSVTPAAASHLRSE